MKAQLKPLAVLAAAATLLGGMMLPGVANAAETDSGWRSAASLGNQRQALKYMQDLNRLRTHGRPPLSGERIYRASKEDYGDACTEEDVREHASLTWGDDGQPIDPLETNQDMMRWAQTRADELATADKGISHDDTANGAPSWTAGGDPRLYASPHYRDHTYRINEWEEGYIVDGNAPENLADAANGTLNPVELWASERDAEPGYWRQGYGHYLTEINPLVNVGGMGVAQSKGGTTYYVLEVAYDGGLGIRNVSVEDALADVERRISMAPDTVYETQTTQRTIILHKPTGDEGVTQTGTRKLVGKTRDTAEWSDFVFPEYRVPEIPGYKADAGVIPSTGMTPEVRYTKVGSGKPADPGEGEPDDPHKGDAGEGKPGRPDKPHKGGDRPTKPTGSPARKADRMAAQYRNVLEDGTWTMRSVFGARVLDVAGGNRGNGGNIQIYDGNGTPAQEWTVTHDSKGYVSLRNRGSGRMLDLVGGAARRGRNIDQYEANGTRAQKWIATHSPTGIVLRSAVNPDYAVDIAGGADRNGVNVRLWDANGSRAQSWAAALTPRAQARRWAADNRHEAVDGTWVMRSGINTVIDVSGGSRGNGANVQSYEANRTGAQEWVLSHDRDGFITIRNRVSGRVLDVAGGYVGDGTNIRQWDANGSLAQKWVAVRGNGGFSLRSALDPYYAVDIAGGSHADGANIRLWEYNGSGAQVWVLKPTPRGQADRLAAASGDVLEDGTYTVRSNVGGRMVLDVAGGSRADGADVRLWRSNGTRAQKWTVSHDRQGYVTLRNGSGRMLDAVGGVGRDGTNIDQYRGNGTRAQKWVAVKHGNAVVLHSAIDPLLVVDVAGGGNRNGTEVRLWEGNDSRAQDWVFQR